MQTISIKAKKSLGQNFLIDHEALLDISESIDIENQHIIEVGPGYGALTDYILQSNPTSLDLVELDSDMVKILEEKLGVESTDFRHRERSETKCGDPGVSEDLDCFVPRNDGAIISLHHQDVLTYTPRYEDYSVIANIPYYITSPILFHFLYDLHNPPEAMVIMMQKEVGEKILEGRARKPHHSFISLAMEQACEDIERVRYVGRESFDPPPKVDSIVLKFSGKKDRDSHLEKQLLSLWKVAFAHPRKTLLSNMKGSTYDVANFRNVLLELGYDERVRAEALKKEDWERFL